MPQQTVEERLARIEEKMDAFGRRLEEVVVSQLRNQGKRLYELEGEVHSLREKLAHEQGMAAGRKAVWAVIFAVVSAAGGLAGAVLARGV